MLSGPQKQHRVRRGRGAVGDPRRLRLPDARASARPCWSAARTWCTRTCAGAASTRPRPASRSSTPACRDRNADYVDYLYSRLQREGYLRRDVQRLINQDRNAFAASMVALGHADGMVTGVTRNFDQVLEEVLRVIDPAPGGRVIGMSVVLAKGRTLFIADTNVTEMPEAEELVEIAIEAARAVAAARLRRRAWPS